MENNLIAEKLNPVLDKEREINNTILWKMGQGKHTPEWVKKGKLAHAARLFDQGKSFLEIAKAVGTTTMTLQAWRAKYHMLDQRYQGGPRGKRRLVAGKKVSVPPSFSGKEPTGELDPKRVRAGKIGAAARWAKVREEQKMKRHYTKRKGFHRITYSMVQKRDFVAKAKELYANGQARHNTEAAKLLGISPGALHAWMRGKFGRGGVLDQAANGRPGLTISLDQAKDALTKAFGAQIPPAQMKGFLLTFENALLREILEG